MLELFVGEESISPTTSSLGGNGTGGNGNVVRILN
jgi:hypothetical protein